MATITACCPSGEQGPRSEHAGRLGRPAQGRIQANRLRSPAIRALRNQAILGVYAAGLARARAAGEAAGKAALSSSRSSTPRATSCRSSARPRTLAQGQTPIVVTWDYNALAGRDTLDGNPPVESSCRRPASSPASMCRRSAPTRRIRTPRSCGWSISIRTKASSAG